LRGFLDRQAKEHVRDAPPPYDRPDHRPEHRSDGWPDRLGVRLDFSTATPAGT